MIEVPINTKQRIHELIDERAKTRDSLKYWRRQLDLVCSKCNDFPNCQGCDVRNEQIQIDASLEW